MNCERCGGLAVEERLSIRLWALRCIVCGWRFHEAVLDLHHGFSIPPEPHTVILPVYDPTHRRLLLKLEC